MQEYNSDDSDCSSDDGLPAPEAKMQPAWVPRLQLATPGGSPKVEMAMLPHGHDEIHSSIKWSCLAGI